MSEIEKFFTILCIVYGSYALYEKCEATPRHGLCGKFFTFVTLVYFRLSSGINDY